MGILVGIVVVLGGGIFIFVVDKGDESARARSDRGGGGGARADSVGAQGSIDEAILGTHSCQYGLVEVLFQRQDSKTPFGVVGVAKALIAISGLLGETHSSSTGRVAFVASALRRDNEADHETASTIARTRYKIECLSGEQSGG